MTKENNTNQSCNSDCKESDNNIVCQICKLCKYLDSFYMCFNKNSKFYNHPRESRDTCEFFEEGRGIDSVYDTRKFKVF